MINPSICLIMDLTFETEISGCEFVLPQSRMRMMSTTVNEQTAGLATRVNKRECLAGSQDSIYCNTGILTTELTISGCEFVLPHQDKMMSTTVKNSTAGLTTRVNKRECLAGSQGSTYCETDILTTETDISGCEFVLPHQNTMMTTTVSKSIAGLTTRVNKRECLTGSQGSAYCETGNQTQETVFLPFSIPKFLSKMKHAALMTKPTKLSHQERHERFLRSMSLDFPVKNSFSPLSIDKDIWNELPLENWAPYETPAQKPKQRGPFISWYASWNYRPTLEPCDIKLRRNKIIKRRFDKNQPNIPQQWIETTCSQKIRSKGSLAFYRKRQMKKLRVTPKMISQTLVGEFQSLLGFDFNVNWPKSTKITTEHIMRIPAVEQLIAGLTEDQPGINWVKIVKEFVFFGLHLKMGGLTFKNLSVCFAHLISEMPIKGLLDRFDLGRFTREPEARRQTDASEACQVAATAIAGFVSLLGVWGLSTCPSSKQIDNFIMRFSKIGSMITSVEKLTSATEKVRKLVLNFIRTTVLGYDNEDLKEMESFEKFYSDVYKINTSDFLHRATNDGGVLKAEVERLVSESQRIAKIFDALRLPHTETRRFHACYLALMKFNEQLSGAGVGQLRARVPPFVVHFHGSSGVGKSQMLNFLNADLLVAMGCRKPEDMVNRVYTRHCQNEFWDGFTNGAKIVVFDDLGSIKDSITRPTTEGIEQIRVTNSVPFRPQMADLTGKATAVFEAEVVIWTTNLPYIPFVSMNNPEAVWNRVHMRFHQTIRDEYAITKNNNGTVMKCLDAAKVMRAIETNPEAIRECYSFTLQSLEGRGDWTTLTIDGREMKDLTYYEMRDLVIEGHRRNQMIGKGTQSRTEDYFMMRCRAAEAASEEALARAEGRLQAGPDSDSESDDGYDPLDDEALYDRFDNQPPPEPEGLPPPIPEPPHEEPIPPFFATPSWYQYFNGGGHGYHVNVFAALNVPVPENDDVVYPNSVEIDPSLMRRVRRLPVDGRANEVDLNDLGVRRGIAGTSIMELAQIYAGISCIKCDTVEDAQVLVGKLRTCYNIWRRSGSSVGFAGLIRHPQYSPCRHHHDERERGEYQQTIWNEEVYAQNHTLLQRLWHGAKLRGGWIWKSMFAPVIEWIVFQYDRINDSFNRWMMTSGYVMRLVTVTGLSLGIHWVVRWLLRLVLSYVFPNYMTMFNEFETACKCGKLEDALRISDDYWKGTYRPQGHPERAAYTKSVSGKREGYSVQGQKAQPTGKVEGPYAPPAAKGTPHVQVETAYANGGVKVQQTGKVESYPFAATKAQPVAKVESANDQNAMEIERKLARNMYALQTSEDGKEWRFKGTCTFVCGRLAITNRHIKEQLLKFTRIVAPMDRQIYMVETKELNFAEFEEGSYHERKDVVMIEWPKMVHSHSDIRKYFMTGEDFSRHSELASCNLVGFNRQGFIHALKTSNVAVDQHEVTEVIVGEGRVVIRDFYLYDLNTQAGDCGSVLVANDLRFNRKICGIHMMGFTNGFRGIYTGASVAITQHTLDTLIHALAPESQALLNGEVEVPMPLDVSVEEGCLVLPETPLGEFNALGFVKTPVHSSTQTTIRQSVVSDLCGPMLKKPAYLRRTVNESGERVDPLSLAMRKLKTGEFHLDQMILKQATNDVQQMICSVKNESDRRTLTMEEAIAGIEGDECYPGVNRSTSPGYGWLKIGKGKSRWLGSEGPYKTDDPELQAALNEGLARLESGRRMGKFWTDTLKDELRPIAKVEQGKTRLFSAGEMAQTIMLRKFFMGFCAHLTRNKISLESCIGMNVHGLDWTILAERLLQVGPNIIAGDFTNYDGTLPAEILWSVLDIILSFYRDGTEQADDDNRVRELLWLEIVNSVHVQRNIVYMWTHSQPSGCPFTSILNSVAHSILFRYAFLWCARKYSPQHFDLKYFRTLIRHNNYGDDDVTGVSVELPWFNQTTVTEALATIGMTYTDELKTGESYLYKKLEDIMFLQRAFRYDSSQSRWRAPLNINTIREMPCWNKTKGDQYSLTADVLQDAFEELCAHDRQTFDEVFPMFEQARIRIYGIAPMRFTTYEAQNLVELAKCYPDVPLSELGQTWGKGPVTKTTKQCDLALAQIAETRESIAAVATGLFQSNQESVGEDSSSIGQRVPTKNNRLLTRPATVQVDSPVQPRQGVQDNEKQTDRSQGQRKTREDVFKDAMKMVSQEQMFAALGNNKPTMCYNSLAYKPPYVAKWYQTSSRCGPCDFHSGREVKMFEAARVRAAKQLSMACSKKTERENKMRVRLANELGEYQSGNQDVITLGEVRKAMNGLPTMCESAYDFSAQDVTSWYTRVPACHPCQFHRGADRNIVWSAIRLATKRRQRGVVVGSLQAGDEEVASEKPGSNGPDFAGNAAVVKREELVTFVEDGQVEESVRGSRVKMFRPADVGAQDLLKNGITDFLARPVHVASFIWKTTDIIRQKVINFELLKTWLSKPMISEKLKGFRYLKMTLVVKVQVNNQPFNAGALLCHFRPFEAQMVYTPSNWFHFGGMTGLNCVLFRCGESTSVELRIPYWNLLSHIDLMRHGGTMGQFVASVISPLTGSDDCDGTVWMWAEDVDLTMPTGRNYRLEQPAVKAELQSGGTAQKAEKEKRPGNVETICDSLATASGAMKDVPLVSDFAGLGEIIFRKGASVAQFFGWSKPNDPEFVTQLQPSFARNNMNFNGDAKTKVLALDARNAVNIPTHVTQTDEDEMAFHTLMKRPTFMTRFEWKSDNQQDSLLWEWPVDPAACEKAIAKNGEQTLYIQRMENNVSYMTSLAGYWRGGIKYHFKVIKTNFHSGRLRVTYVPGAWQQDSVDRFDLNKCYSEIIDLRDTSDFDFEVPYSMNQMWMPTVHNVYRSGPALSERLPSCVNDVMGMVYVTVVNGLRAPTTAADHVDILVYTSVCDDFQLNFPLCKQVYPVNRGIDLIAAPLYANYQSGDDVIPSDMSKMDCNASTFGEAFTGFRQWLKRYQPYHLSMAGPKPEKILGNYKGTKGGDDFFIEGPFFPFYSGNSSDGQLSSNVPSVDWHMTPWWRAERLYLFKSGSMRLLFDNHANKTFRVRCAPASSLTERFLNFGKTNPVTGTAPVRPIIVEDMIGIGDAITTSAEKTTEVTIPFYSVFPAMFTSVGRIKGGEFIADGLTTVEDNPVSVGTVVATDFFGNDDKADISSEIGRVFRAAGEDFNYGYFIGVPVTRVKSSFSP